MTLWDPTATVARATSDAGPFTGGAVKAVLHTTEGHRYADALTVFQTRGYWPESSATIESGQPVRYQHLPINRAGKALEHPAGTGQTNTDNVHQIEIVGSADPDYARRNGLLYVEDFPDDLLAAVAAWLRFLHVNAGLELVAPFPFGRPGTVRRPPWAIWHATGGIYGHCHVPANSHVDPGLINIARILELAGATHPTPTRVDPQPSPPVPITWNGAPAMKQTIPVAIDTNGNGQALTAIPMDKHEAMTAHAEAQYKIPHAGPLEVNGMIEVQVTGHTPSPPPPAPAWFAYVDVIYSV